MTATTAGRTSVEVCDGIDNDRDSMVDQGAQVAIFADIDADGSGDASKLGYGDTRPRRAPPSHHRRHLSKGREVPGIVGAVDLATCGLRPGGELGLAATSSNELPSPVFGMRASER